MDSLVELFIDRDDNVERAFLNCSSVIAALEEVHLRQNQYLRAFNESVELVL